MDKILVEIFLPASNHYYDVYIPNRGKVYEVIEMLGEALMELSKGYFIKTQDLVLCSAETMKVLDINSSIQDLDIKNGSKLILI